MFPCTDHRSHIWLNAALSTPACPAHACVRIGFYIPSRPNIALIWDFIGSAVLVEFFKGLGGVFLGILTLLSRFLWFGDAKAQRSARAFQLGCPWAHTASLVANKPPEGVWGPFDAVAELKQLPTEPFWHWVILFCGVRLPVNNLALRDVLLMHLATRPNAEINLWNFKGKEGLSPFPHISMLIWSCSKQTTLLEYSLTGRFTSFRGEQDWVI